MSDTTYETMKTAAITMTIEDLRMVRDALYEQKRRATADGSVWSEHSRNAALRTEVETRISGLRARYEGDLEVLRVAARMLEDELSGHEEAAAECSRRLAENDLRFSALRKIISA